MKFGVFEMIDNVRYVRKVPLHDLFKLFLVCLVFNSWHFPEYSSLSPIGYVFFLADENNHKVQLERTYIFH